MFDTEKKTDFEMFRATLTKLERLIGVWSDLVTVRPAVDEKKTIYPTVGDSTIHTLKLLVDFDINTSESNTIEELERLVSIYRRIDQKRFDQRMRSAGFLNIDRENAHDNVQGLIIMLIDSKTAFLKNGAFSRLVSEGGVEPMTALERLTKVQVKFWTFEMQEVLISRVNEVAHDPVPKPLTQSAAACSTNVVNPIHASQKQETPNHNLPGEGEMPKTTQSVSGSSSGLGDQNNIHMQWLLNQNKVHEEWIHKQIEAQMNRDVDSQLKIEDKVHKQLTQDQNKVNMQWLQDQNSATMVWIRDQNEAQMKWHQKQNEAHTAKDDADSSEEDGGELTPTSTIKSG